nr:uncharacterized protein LOC124812429 [Hydra vulgaris]
MGFAHCILIKCSICDWMKPFYTSPKTSYNLKIDFRGRKTFDVNARAVIGFREIGCVFSFMQKFSSIMNLKYMASFSFKLLNKKLMTAYKNVAESSMKRAAEEAQKIDLADNIKCVRVSIDGSWQKRGHASLHGVVTAISGDKCLDMVVKSKHCFGCKMWENKKGSLEYDKLECVGHAQKRLGTRLRNLVKSYKGTKTPVSEKGQLTDKCIDSMQNYYGMAIRSNLSNVYAMKKAIYAILFHFTNTNDPLERHKFFPRDTNSWCKYCSKCQKEYKPSNTISFWIKSLLLPIFKDLMDENLLKNVCMENPECKRGPK